MTIANEQDVLAIVAKHLRKRGFQASIAHTIAEARAMLKAYLRDSSTVGMGDSATLRQVGVVPLLDEMGIAVINPFPVARTVSPQSPEFHRTLKQALDAEVFLASVNVVTLDGMLVSIDRAGNRLSGTIFGPTCVILVVGRNKIVTDLNEAYKRLKQVIVPNHAMAKGRRTPCAVCGYCPEHSGEMIDSSPERMCNAILILQGKPLYTDVRVLLVNYDLGLGWNPGWDGDRIETIKKNYLRVTLEN